MTTRTSGRVSRGAGVARGLSAAVRAGRVVRGPALHALLAPPPARAAGVGAGADADVARRATAVAFAALRVLAVPLGQRNTCLYRAVAECLVLRGLGMPATLRLGVARGAGTVIAHAWVECPGHRCRAGDGDGADTYAPLRHAAGGAA